uniref:glycosyltransferase family 2 protein n=1 Tax=Stieleria tagensis TaxID=2956795 RepID=UPI00209BA11D|nr:glycosyltransferase [Stieleria tagensis]MCO8122332.1 glycosyltransferase [Stieleria tagensis]
MPADTMHSIPCPFRYNERQVAGSQVATCGLIQQILQTTSTEHCDVDRHACQACVEATFSGTTFQNDVFPSLLNQAGAHWLQAIEIDDQSVDNSNCRVRVAELIESTERAIVDDSFFLRSAIVCCDVFVCCSDDSDQTRQAIRSVLNQENAEIRLHLVITGAAAESLVNEFADQLGVQIHRFESPIDLPRAIQQLAPLAASEFIALQATDCISRPRRIASAVQSLQSEGADFAGAPMTALNQRVSAEKPDASKYRHSLPWPTLVFRRSTFVDLGGFADRSTDVVEELLFRAASAGAQTVVGSQASVHCHVRWEKPALGALPRYQPREGSYSHHAIGFPLHSVACDVVLPIYGQLEYAQASIESVIDQQGAETVVHLIDDQSPQSTDELFRYWGSHPRIRLYRNQENIGQYASFNNVSEYFETDTVAVQDGDDISMPHRLHDSVNLLRLSQADYFAAAMTMFGDQDVIQAAFGDRQQRESFYPRRSETTYFAMNPTSCFNVSMFRSLGGYAQYGPSTRNGMDSELMTRAYFAGVRFCISRRVVTQYRVHRQAATRRTDSGFGSPSRARAMAECRRRRQLYAQTPFDPRSFGALKMHHGVTKRLE